MAGKKNPYPHQNFAQTEDYLEELMLWTSGERGRVAIDEASNGYEDLTVDDSEAKGLTVPDIAISASVFFEVDGTAPTATSGQSFGDGDVLELFGKTSLDNFQVIGIEAGKSHILRIQYYKTSQA